ncbi:MAG: MFS transporter, partial [Planctomycetota bacterium]
MAKSDSDAGGGFFYGWVVLGIATLATVATSPGQSYLVGVFNEPIGRAVGIEEKQITLAYGIATACAALPLLLVGRLADRFGPKAVMIGSSIGLGIGCFAIGFVEGVWSLGVAYFFIRFMGQGALGLSASHSTAMWFE